MRSVNLVTGLIAKARRYVSQAASVSLHTQEGEKEPSMGEVSKALRQMGLRLNRVESALPPEATEFEVVLGANGAITELTHSFGGPVRFWVTCWTQTNNVSYPTASPSLAMDSTSDQDTLRLRSYVAGRAVIRVEPSQTYLDPGTVVGTSPAVHGVLSPQVSGLRLTLTSATPVTSADVTGATTIYLTPYISGQIRLYYNSEWMTRSTTEASLALGTLTSGSNYDVFAYWSGTAVALALSAAWTNDTTRADALAYQDGTLVKSSDHTMVYVGTIRMTSTTQTEDSKLKRFCWNMYNRVTRFMSVVDTTASWTYVNSNSVWRQVRASAANQFEAVTGEATEFSIRSSIGGSNNQGALALDAGIGIDSTTVNSAQIFNTWTNAIGQLSADRAHYSGVPGVGYHKYVWLETGGGAVATWTYFGTGAGMTAEFLG